MDKACEKIINIVEEKNWVVNNLINNAGIESFEFFNVASIAVFIGYLCIVLVKLQKKHT